MANFFKEFFGVFFGGMLGLFFSSPSTSNYGGLFGSFYQMFNFPLYVEIFQKYKDELSTGEWIGAIISSILIIAALAAIIWLIIFFGIRLFKKFTGDRVLNQDLVDEINNLKKELIKTVREKDRILGLKIAYQGYDIL